jgi:hypothetical protein
VLPPIAPEIREWLEATTQVVAILGVPAGVFLFLREWRRDRALREQEIYAALNQGYIDYLKLCFDNPALDIFEWPLTRPEVAASGLPPQKLIAFTMLIALFEKAYFLHSSFSSRHLDRQWNGWLAYMTEWLSRPDFLSAWPMLAPQFDSSFVRFAQRLIPPDPPSPSP